MSNQTGYALLAASDRDERPWASFRRSYAVLALLVLLLATAPLVLEGYLLAGLTRGMIYGLAACAVGFLIRHGGMVSFGHAAYFGIGAYVVLVAQKSGLNEALIVWPLSAAVVSWLVYRTVECPMIRLGRRLSSKRGAHLMPMSQRAGVSQASGM